MKSRFTKKFLEEYDNFPREIQKKFQKQLRFLVSDIRHPSLHAKKYDESSDKWQARVDKNVRFYFLIQKDTYILVDIRYHPK